MERKEKVRIAFKVIGLYNMIVSSVSIVSILLGYMAARLYSPEGESMAQTLITIPSAALAFFIGFVLWVLALTWGKRASGISGSFTKDTKSLEYTILWLLVAVSAVVVLINQIYVDVFRYLPIATSQNTEAGRIFTMLLISEIPKVILTTGQLIGALLLFSKSSKAD